VSRYPEIDPDELLMELRRSGGEPPLEPLALSDPPASDRRWPVGEVVGFSRRAVLRLIAPTLSDLLGQLERDRHRLASRVLDLERRVGQLERRERDSP
jgi:hypothetical protein